MDTLFEHASAKRIERESPLANRMRPRTLDEFVGQEHIVGPGRLLRRAIQADQLSSLIFYGPPGTGKTTLARVIANTTQSHFITINAVLAGVKEIRAAIDDAKGRRAELDQRSTLFVDEVHRWNKAQQDALLPHVENGTLVLVGATTENPYFEVNKALVSRSRIFQLKPLTEDALRRIAEQALGDPERGYGQRDVRIDDDALAHLVQVANGDARSVLNALELAVETTPEDGSEVIRVDLAVAEESIQRRAVLYDKEGDVHYDTISAFIKSLRGSDPDGALYWMAKMVYAGEDPRFIFRRMAILAGEDVGMADPHAGQVVASCWEIFERVGMPEGRFPLAQAALYLATCPKSNSGFAFFDALKTVKQEREADVPNHLKDPSRDKEGFGHGEGYLYPHAYRDHWVAQQYLPEGMQGKVFYEPSDQGYELRLRGDVSRRREEQLAAMVETPLGTPEILVTSPENRARDAWLQRAIASAGRSLGKLRDRLFEAAQIQRHHLVLDLHAGSGLLSWEAMRCAAEGGVWAHTTDPGVGQALRQQATRLPELERVQVLVGAPAEVGGLLAQRDQADVRFDRILGRNPFSVPPDESSRAQHWAALSGMLWERLLPAGRLCLAQVLPRRAQRLYALVDWSGEDQAVAAAVRAAEETLYEAADDPRLGWDAPALQALLEDAGFESVTVDPERTREERRITEAHLARWFPTAESGPPTSYAAHLRADGVDDAALTRVAALYRRHLANQVVTWEATVALVLASRP